MIKLQDLTPAVYYEQSRDFQFLGRLYDLVLNYIKTNAANLYNLPVGQNMNEQLLNLLALTLGLKTTKQYNSKQLLAICTALPTILKHKGSIQAVILATNALLTAEGVKQPLDYTIIPAKGITLYVAQDLSDLTLFTDLLEYLLPAGLSCTIIKEIQAVEKVEQTFAVESSIKINGIESTDDRRKADDWLDVVDSTDLSQLANIESITGKRANGAASSRALLDGAIGTKPSILSNVTLIKHKPAENPTKAATGEDKNDE